MKYLVIAYGIIWIGTIGYCLSLAFSLKGIKRDLAELKKKLQK
jgi:CcmD family protein